MILYITILIRCDTPSDQDNEDIDHAGTSEVVCPHCGFTFSDSSELFDDYATAAVVDCDECCEMFNVEREFTVTYTTRKLD